MWSLVGTGTKTHMLINMFMSYVAKMTIQMGLEGSKKMGNILPTNLFIHALRGWQHWLTSLTALFWKIISNTNLGGIPLSKVLYNSIIRRALLVFSTMSPCVVLSCSSQVDSRQGSTGYHLVCNNMTGNSDLAVEGALTHLLQRLQNPKLPPRVLKIFPPNSFC